MNTKTVQKFAEAIKQHNVERMSVLMTDDHNFNDNRGNEVIGKAQITIILVSKSPKMEQQLIQI